MKLQNYNTVVSTVEQIIKHEQALKSLTDGNISVIINDANEDLGRIMTIGVVSEHDLAYDASIFIDHVKNHLRLKIEGLNKALLEL